MNDITEAKINCRPISLLPICSKIFEKIIFNEIYNFLLEEGLSNPNQYGVRPGDFCINQLLAITHKTFEAFDCNPSLEVSLVFSYIYQKLLARFAMKACFIRLSPWVYQKNLTIWFKAESFRYTQKCCFK